MSRARNNKKLRKMKAIAERNKNPHPEYDLFIKELDRVLKNDSSQNVEDAEIIDE